METELLQTDLEQLTPRLFEQAIYYAFYEGVTIRRLYGHSGPTFLLYGASRCSEVSVRNWSGLASMLITDAEGNFLFSGHLPLGLGLAEVAKQFHSLLQTVRPHLAGKVPTLQIPTRAC